MRRADHSSRGVLLTVVRRCVWPRNPKNVEAMIRVESQRHMKTKVNNLAKNRTKSSLFRRYILFYYNDVRFHVLCDVTSQYIHEQRSRNTFTQLQRASYQKPVPNTRYLHDLENSFIFCYCTTALLHVSATYGSRHQGAITSWRHRVSCQ